MRSELRCRSNRGIAASFFRTNHQEPKSEQQDTTLTVDENLKELIEAEIFSNRKLSAHQIHVEVSGHQATLTGMVKSYREKLLACEIALSFNEIRDVIDDMEIQTVSDASDEEIELRIRNTFEASADVTSETIKISGHDGKITLTGSVATYVERMVAEDLARGVAGVVSIENLLVVNLEEKVADEELGNAIKAAIKRKGRLKDQDINVAVCDGVVELNGTVKELWHKELAESIVRRFDILHIDNDLIVT